MNDFVKVLQKIERSLSEEKGMFTLFALFVLEETPGRWDLLVAAPWIQKNTAVGRRRVAEELQESLSRQELRNLSNLIIVDQDNPGLAALQRDVHAEHGDIEFRDRNYFGLDVRHAHVITCTRTEAARKTVRARRNDSVKPRRDSRKRRPQPDAIR
jgi:hypothetical protein